MLPVALAATGWLMTERPDVLIAPGGERFEDFEARIHSFIDDLTRPTVVVAHGLLGQVLRGVILGKSRREMARLSNLQGCVFHLENGQETILHRLAEV